MNNEKSTQRFEMYTLLRNIFEFLLTNSIREYLFTKQENELFKLKIIEEKTNRQIADYYNIHPTRVSQMIRIMLRNLPMRIHGLISDYGEYEKLKNENIKLRNENKYCEIFLSYMPEKYKDRFTDLLKKDIRITDTGLSVRAINILLSAEIKSINDLKIYLWDKDLIKHRKCGKRTKNEIMDYLKSLEI